MVRECMCVCGSYEKVYLCEQTHPNLFRCIQSPWEIIGSLIAQQAGCEQNGWVVEHPWSRVY